MTWSAGAATVELNVPPGTTLDGYGTRSGTSSGTLDPLEVNTVALAAGGQVAILTSLDLLAADAAWVRALRSRVWVEHRIPPERVLVGASHTHAGPAGFRCMGAGAPFDEAARQLRRRFLDLTASAITSAVKSLRPAELRLGSAGCTVGAHRHDPRAPVDERLSRLDILAHDGAHQGTVWHYACHATVLGPDNLAVSADLPGGVRAELRRRHNATLPVVYLNGAAADVSTRFTRRQQSVEEVRRLGKLAADAMQFATHVVPPARPAGKITQCALPRALDDEASLEHRMKTMKHRYDQCVRALDTAHLRVLQSHLVGLEKRLARCGTGASENGAKVNADVQLLELGELILVCIPGELYAEQGLELRALTGARHVLPVGYSGGYVGYLPPAGAAGGYESDSAVVAVGSGNRLVGAAREALSGEGGHDRRR